MGPTHLRTEPYFLLDLYLYAKFGVNWIEIATSTVYTHTYIHTENLSSRDIGEEI